MVNREPGSGSRATLDTALKAAKITGPALPGYADVVTSHLAIARRVRDGAADCGIATESAALLLGLSFIPLAAHRYDLVLRRQHLDLPQIKALLDSLHRSTFLRRLHGMCAYEVGTTGAVIPVESGLEKR
jgi:putative molybdopterin biosynthesis protein